MTDRTPSLVVVCTANLCRSPMAAALLALALGPGAAVRSAGLDADPGRRPTDDVVQTMAARGIDLRDHRSRALDADTIAGADVVLTMTREHVRRIAVAHSGSFPRTFTLRELVRRAGDTGRRPPDATLQEWLALVGRDRKATDLLGGDPADDIADPYGHGPAAHERAAIDLASAVDAFVGLAFPGSSAPPGAR